ncbi:MAG: indolepyruvate ferredoxin oxidoreductase subunit alpha [Desulfobacteraceae bacterium]|nr:indolepyruvate ferredoxin oxidoreductase subunit alpha [Desulfobacteraceae bacterium]MCF8094827.1 indolepyruvate ferredoxin oxidoreductase subunit alpha [Desulfobacteraceae bacterium]
MHKLLQEKAGEKLLLLGNEAVARGAIEAGVAFAATYPGTPSSEISANLYQMSFQSDLYFEYSTNEKVALEVCAAAANSGVRSMCIMKHVGMNVASDAMMTLAYVGVKAGLVILTADDPYMFSSQNEQDNRYYGKLSGLPILEPSNVDEAKRIIPYAFELSENLGEPVIVRTTTRLNHSTGPVVLGELASFKTKGEFVKDPFHLVTVPAVSRNLHARLIERIAQAESLSCDSPYNFIQGNGSSGIVVNGVSYNYVADAVAELGIEDRVSIFRVGFSHPMPGQKIKEFLNRVEKVLVVEEGEPYMEEALRALAQQAGLTLEIRGKAPDLFSRLFEYDPALVREKIAAYFEVPYQAPAPPELSDVPEIPQRPPNLCAGCSHRATFYAVNKATEGMETIKPTDIGCYTLGFMPPLSAGDFLICMGSSTGTGGGFSRATGKKVISFIGDSTFFHSGIPGLINAVFNNHDITVVILDNQTTAMTGHQPHPGVDMAAFGRQGYGRVSIESVVEGVGVPHVSVIRPYNVKKSIAAIKEAVDFEGVSVVIARQDCVLLARTLKKKTGRPFTVNPDKCRNHRNCINELACPAFYIENQRVCIDASMCTGCSVCAQVCPENAIVPLKEGN